MAQDVWNQIPFPEDISEEKKQFLTEAIEGSKNLKRQELLPYLTRLIRASKEKNLSFTDEEIKFIITAIKNNSTPEQNQYIDKILNMNPQKPNS